MELKDNQIQGVLFKNLKTFPDQRGYFREVIRSSDDLFAAGKFAQWSHSKMTKGVVKAWHYHHIQTDWWYIAYGAVETVLYDNRNESPTYKTKLIIPMNADPESNSVVSVRIPPGVLHGCRVISSEAHLMYITSEVYNTADEGRLPYNSNLVPHDWGTDAITSENDRREIAPTTTRVISI